MINKDTFCFHRHHDHLNNPMFKISNSFLHDCLNYWTKKSTSSESPLATGFVIELLYFFKRRMVIQMEYQIKIICMVQIRYR